MKPNNRLSKYRIDFTDESTNFNSGELMIFCSFTSETSNIGWSTSFISLSVFFSRKDVLWIDLSIMVWVIMHPTTPPTLFPQCGIILGVRPKTMLSPPLITLLINELTNYILCYIILLRNFYNAIRRL